MAESKKALKITLKRSGISRPAKHKRILIALGLRKRERPIVRTDGPEVRGMLQAVSHLVEVETVTVDDAESGGDN